LVFLNIYPCKRPKINIYKEPIRKSIDKVLPLTNQTG
jgi:hypothetical protein